jgi:hypothetical protein
MASADLASSQPRLQEVHKIRVGPPCASLKTVERPVAPIEHTVLLLTEVVDKNNAHRAAFAPVAKERTILPKVNRFKQILDRQTGLPPAAIKEDLDTHFTGILSLIRNFRNESGHPSGKIIDREQAFVLLELLPAYAKKMHQLMDFFR